MITLRPLPKRPNRRTGEVHDFIFQGIEFAVTINFDLVTHAAYEVFLSRKTKDGGLFSAMLSDACISISKHLEAGRTASELVEMFGADRWEGVALKDAPPSSPFGVIVRCAALREAQLRAGGP